MKFTNIAILALAATVSACVAGPSVSPVEITRFHQGASVAQLGAGTIFIADAPVENYDADDARIFKSAIAAELTRLGYREVPRSEASQHRWATTPATCARAS